MSGGNVVAFANPKRIKRNMDAALIAVEALEQAVVDDQGRIYMEDMTEGLIQMVYQTFYAMAQRGGINPGDVCVEIDLVLAALSRNLPVVKSHVWQMKPEECTCDK